ncbi:flagellar basal-body rod protein FlgG [Escherichia coli]|uniref:Flagellar basal-body rod protein FlgG n=1 Tax=Escherichia coli TaxID=562 RepID=A0A377E5Q2_ECOLX|nr:flagellar basal-body rod protein FlgG [Escherichia coli]
MISSLWIAKTGLDAQQTNMDVIANNLANVSTNGFKRQRAVFEDLLYQTIRQPGHSLPNKPPYPPDYKSARGYARSPLNVYTARATCRRPTTAKMSRLKGRAFSR